MLQLMLSFKYAYYDHAVLRGAWFCLSLVIAVPSVSMNRTRSRRCVQAPHPAV